ALLGHRFPTTRWFLDKRSLVVEQISANLPTSVISRHQEASFPLNRRWRGPGRSAARSSTGTSESLIRQVRWAGLPRRLAKRAMTERRRHAAREWSGKSFARWSNAVDK